MKKGTIKPFHANITYRRLKKGLIKRPDNCENCGKEGPVHGHHPDYEQPNHVIWLCPKCHRLVHKITRKSKALPNFPIKIQQPPKNLEDIGKGLRIDEKIRYLRGKMGLSQTELATQTGLSNRTICGIERGMGCSLKTIRTLAKVLGFNSLEFPE